MSESDTTTSTNSSSNVKSPVSSTTDNIRHPLPARFAVPCLCKACTRPLNTSGLPIKFVITGKMPHDYQGTRKKSAVYVTANIMIGCIVMFFYFLYLYFTVGKGLRNNDDMKVKRQRHIYMCCIGVTLGFGGGIMAMCPAWVALGWISRRLAHTLLTAFGLGLYIYGGTSVYLYNDFLYHSGLSKWDTFMAILIKVDSHEVIGVLSFILIVVTAVTAPFTCINKSSKFIHAVIGCIAFVIAIFTLFSAMWTKNVFPMIQTWQMYHAYFGTILLVALFTVIVLVQPVINFYLGENKN